RVPAPPRAPSHPAGQDPPGDALEALDARLDDPDRRPLQGGPPGPADPAGRGAAVRPEPSHRPAPQRRAGGGGRGEPAARARRSHAPGACHAVPGGRRPPPPPPARLPACAGRHGVRPGLLPPPRRALLVGRGRVRVRVARRAPRGMSRTVDDTPTLSVVIATTQPWPEIAGCLASLVGQAGATGAGVILADAAGRGLPGGDAFPEVQWLTAPGGSVFQLRALAMSKARGEIVA